MSSQVSDAQLCVTHLVAHCMPRLVPSLTPEKSLHRSDSYVCRGYLCLPLLFVWEHNLSSSFLFVCVCVCKCVRVCGSGRQWCLSICICFVGFDDCEKQPLTYFTRGSCKINTTHICLQTLLVTDVGQQCQLLVRDKTH